MPIIETNIWLEEYVKQQGKSWKDDLVLQQDVLIEKLVPYFNDASIYEIQDHLCRYGFFLPTKRDDEIIAFMLERGLWEKAANEFSRLKKEWKGPDVPVFIFPVNHKSRQIIHELKGMSGLAHQDKVFLFVSGNIDNAQLKALLTHEYNHVCRLHYLNQSEAEATLLDSIIMEGLAEMAVKERVGDKYMAKWSSIYTSDFAQKCWEKWGRQHANIKKEDPRYYDLIYGNGSIPKWMGYNLGFHLVSTFMENANKTVKEALQISSKKIAQGSDLVKKRGG